MKLNSHTHKSAKISRFKGLLFHYYFMGLLFSCVSITQRTHTSTISLNLSLIFVGFAPPRLASNLSAKKTQHIKRKNFECCIALITITPLSYIIMTITALQVWCSSRKKGKKKRTPWTPSSSITLAHSQFTAKPPLAPTPFAALPRRVSRVLFFSFLF